MDVTKLIALLEAGCLFFPRADRLGDPWEGAVSRQNLALRPNLYAQLAPEELAMMSAQLGVLFREQRRHMFISCWHQNEHESAAMWRLYLKSDEGIAIQTTFDRLKEALCLYKDRPVYIGQVRYLDYEKDFVPEGNALAPILHKRNSFAHESEVRAVINTLGLGGVAQASVAENGIYVPISIDVLVERIYIAPTTPEWVFKAIEGMISRYGLERLVSKSALSEPALF